MDGKVPVPTGTGTWSAQGFSGAAAVASACKVNASEQAYFDQSNNCLIYDVGATNYTITSDWTPGAGNSMSAILFRYQDADNYILCSVE